ncbi:MULTISPECIES: ATP-grasp domain-containing protein [unclassified Thermosynechococcus]|uniref:ATP-grasp domain-containing protein n=1 Tax=unclassified Thermosynechococcus TaxID=2622553 RepID=UPI00287350DA|nr:MULTISPECIES: ATP-grasp domain-containing protein [unclassified Thermosynechococcus]WNC32645.1 ATP-grasp domain-containing protein [Thermosynechococcus sp. PKX95]WNC35174.1 ATP-grasp domain-containing protein [Thermosynechococcus sp. PKX91]WNC37692.1 ATP-grasp domain-containing protein [Thermosynechococcus sp. WL11]WNC40213.1 ATP-grasp domain-containing protein [Thermosynechococcus sp. WL17]WNC42733.1 ATP-grasp domain-containing protein [Thermosynechococcus sp. WL15]
MSSVLISPVGGRAIRGILNYFRNKNYTIIGIDSKETAVGKFLCDHFELVPNVHNQDYPHVVKSLIKSYQPEIFISWLDEEILFWNEYFLSYPNDEIKHVFAFNFRDDMNKFYDKFELYTTLSNAGFHCPRSVILSKSEEVESLPFPKIIKPRRSSGSKNVTIVSSPKIMSHTVELIKHNFEDLDLFIAQEFIEGEEYTVDFFCRNGEIINIVCRKRIEHSGVTLLGEIVIDEFLEEYTYQFAKSFTFDGLNNIQIIKTAESLFITDVNMRPSGTIIFSVKAGVDFLLNLIQYKNNQEITKYSTPRKLKMLRYLEEYYYE